PHIAKLSRRSCGCKGLTASWAGRPLPDLAPTGETANEGRDVGGDGHRRWPAQPCTASTAILDACGKVGRASDALIATNHVTLNTSKAAWVPTAPKPARAGGAACMSRPNPSTPPARAQTNRIGRTTQKRLQARRGTGVRPEN